MNIRKKYDYFEYKKVMWLLNQLKNDLETSQPLKGKLSLEIRSLEKGNDNEVIGNYFLPRHLNNFELIYCLLKYDNYSYILGFSMNESICKVFSCCDDFVVNGTIFEKILEFNDKNKNFNDISWKKMFTLFVNKVRMITQNFEEFEKLESE
ncbi:MAG: hypothetical protein NTW62_03600 [Candidatus Nomurabacteria bacterium]|nr:hypothetical protein [Candidatus Nomurabacteria bacterium]